MILKKKYLYVFYCIYQKYKTYKFIEHVSIHISKLYIYILLISYRKKNNKIQNYKTYI